MLILSDLIQVPLSNWGLKPGGAAVQKWATLQVRATNNTCMYAGRGRQFACYETLLKQLCFSYETTAAMLIYSSDAALHAGRS